MQWLQLSRVEVMSSVMPGQNTKDSALAIMADVPWWAACNAAKQVGLRDVMRSLYRMTHLQCEDVHGMDGIL